MLSFGLSTLVRKGASSETNKTSEQYAHLSCVGTLASDYTPSSGRCSQRSEAREKRGVPCPGDDALRSHGFLLEQVYYILGALSSRNGVWGRDFPTLHSHKERPFIPCMNARGFLGRRSVSAKFRCTIIGIDYAAAWSPGVSFLVPVVGGSTL